MFDMKPDQELSFESTLIPQGTLVLCVIEEVRAPKESKRGGTWFSNWTLKVCEGPFAGSKLYDDICTSGEGPVMVYGKMKVAYALEISRNAHVTGNYKIDTLDDVQGMKVLVKVGIDVYQKKDDAQWRYKNVVLAYGSPRPDSRNHQIYSEYRGGLQPYKTDVKPELPIAKHPGNDSADYVNQDIGF